MLEENEILEKALKDLKRDHTTSSPTRRVGEVLAYQQALTTGDDVKNAVLQETTKEIQIKETPIALDVQKTADILDIKDIIAPVLSFKNRQIREAKQHNMELAAKKLELEQALLNIISNNNREGNKEAIIQLLKDYPELQLHGISSFCNDLILKHEVVETYIRDEILSSCPKMFDKYCTIKKENNDQRIRAFQDDGAGEEELFHDNLYRIKSNTLISKSFIYLHPDLMQEMDQPDYKEFKGKIIAQLEKSISFIETKSQGISGLKMSKKKQGVAKIKLAKKDPRIFISDIYRDANGNLLFVAKYIVSHKDQDRDMTRYKYGQIVDKEASIAAIIGEIEIGSARS